MLDQTKCQLFTSGLRGAESAFGVEAEKRGIKETVFTYAGHGINREQASEIISLSDEDLKRGDISMEIVSKMMHRTYYEANKIRSVLQVLFHVVNKGHQVFAVGTILADKTVKGGTGWAVELAKLFNRPLSVFDQDQGKWFAWKGGDWQEQEARIEFETFVGSGTRNLNDAGRAAIAKLFRDSFGI